MDNFLSQIPLDFSKSSRKIIIQQVKLENINAHQLLEIIQKSEERKKIVLIVVLDDLIEENPFYLKNNLSDFLSFCKNQTNETIKRCTSRIWINLLRNKEILMSSDTKEEIIELHFDWLLNDSLVATKSNCLSILFLLRDFSPWIKPELKAVIEKQLPENSISYKARAEKYLKKLIKES